jgi:glycosyltransferase involved in cell wall biosynthesis
MRACIIAYSFYDIDYRVRRYGDALIEQGHDVDVIALRRNGEKTRSIFNGAMVYRIQTRTYDERGMFDYLIKNITFFLKGSLLLAGLSLKHKYDVIHIHNVPDFLVFMGVIPKVRGARLILDIHDIIPELFCQKFRKQMDSFLARCLLLMEKASTRFANHVIAANDLWRLKMISRDKLDPRKCTTLLNHPNISYFGQRQKKNRSNALLLIYPGTISHIHGVDILIRALGLLKKEIPDVCLDIYTRSINREYFAFLQQLIDEVDVKENIHIHDPLPMEQLAYIFSIADIGIVCKREGIFSSEAFSTKIFDYMAAGLPIVCSRTKIDEYYFDDSMIIFYMPEDYSELAECILRLHNDPDKSEQLVERGRKYLENNTWEVKKQVYFSLVKSLIEKPFGTESRAEQNR